MAFTAYSQWQLWQEQQYTMLPVLVRRALAAGADKPASWEKAWEGASPYAFVLESGKDGRYTYLGLSPSSVIRGKSGRAEAVDTVSGSRTVYEGEPLDAVRSWMSEFRAPRMGIGPKWTGGCVGYWSYDIIRSIEKLPESAADDLGLPDYLFLRMDELWIVDHQEQSLYCAVQSRITGGETAEQLQQLYERACAQAEAMALVWSQMMEASAPGLAHNGGLQETAVSGLSAPDQAAGIRQARMELMEKASLHIDVEAVGGRTSPFSKLAYMEAVERIRTYIAQGDVFQVNLSLRQSRETTAAPEELYEWLRLFNPSPYMGMLRCPDFQLVSASPELLVEVSGGRLITRPIAGTRRRGHTEEDDQAMAAELLASEKERAEHIMLVDLERNDLGRIAAYGSVQVKELMAIERYSHVMHLVSQVEGTLAAGKDAYDVIAATFPGGTITGAPKIRTMEIIEELEPVRRGPYTGSLGWIDYNGDMEFNIIIRTMTMKDRMVHIQAGAGIVIDSDPEREYHESLNKAKALWKAIEYSELWAAQLIRG
ncbi:anthranilate synthase component I family protein [Paenibacillus nasutitermitis]|uniref:Aminodeoxychorismate synthase, component I n=1 Tax=Paenibacillus nasutitermitis TaxID=1652958 RepID=A0A917E3L0_9BACL|nr:chorismate-binding protein [Paenibacillus nasutitermitis]GGD99761.1 aminodeoxychorismate synthase, component I [Paenibacillus nasutitermitis]